MKHECKICNKHIAIAAIGQHLKTHKISPKEYHKTYINENDKGICVICQQQTKWVSVTKGHKLFCTQCNRKNIPSCVEYWIYNFNQSYDDAIKSVKSHQINSSTRRIEYWIKQHGQTIEEARQSVADNQRRNKEWYINTYKDEGEIKWEVYLKRQRYTCSVEYLGIEKYNKSILARKGANNINYYIEKYGEVDGKLRYAKKYGYNSYEEFYEHYKKRKYPSIFYLKSFRENILLCQNSKCGLCNTIKGYDIYFHLHHIDYNKDNCDRKNLIFLCNSCHSKTNYNRHYWIDMLNETNLQYIVNS